MHYHVSTLLFIILVCHFPLLNATRLIVLVVVCIPTSDNMPKSSRPHLASYLVILAILKWRNDATSSHPKKEPTSGHCLARFVRCRCYSSLRWNRIQMDSEGHGCGKERLNIWYFPFFGRQGWITNAIQVATRGRLVRCFVKDKGKGSPRIQGIFRSAVTILKDILVILNYTENLFWPYFQTGTYSYLKYTCVFPKNRTASTGGS